MRSSEHINELATALAKAQADIEGASKDATNPAFGGRKYADLSAVWRACRGPLTANGLSVVQVPGFADGRISVETILLHASGQWICGEVSVPLEKEPGRNASQSIGSAVTYLRRYALSAVASVCPEDDDGESSGAKVGARERPRREPPADADGVLVITKAQRERLFAIAGERKVPGDDLKAILVRIAGTGSTRKLPMDKYEAVVDAVQAWTPEPEPPKGAPLALTADSPFGDIAASEPLVMGDEPRLRAARGVVLDLLETARTDLSEHIYAGYKHAYETKIDNGAKVEVFRELGELISWSLRVARGKKETAAQVKAAQEVIA
jgi:hypothetical protein